jgi:2,3-bisphosphoglycerate-dependent phosphoglycerate mutase
MQLYFLRHAQSANNALWAVTGSEKGRTHDPDITDLGRAQAERLAEHLARPAGDGAPDPHDPQNRAGFGLTHIYCSLMLRSVATAAIVAARLGLPLHAWVDWHEEGGLYLADAATGERVGQAGHGRAFWLERYPVLVLPETLGEEGWWNRPFEEAADRPARGQRVLADLLERHGGTDDRVAVVSHGGFYNHFLAAVYGLPGALPVHHLVNNAAISRFAFPAGDRRYVVYQNHAGHLPAEMITF